MAERGSWPSIRKNGLLSTSALLDHFEIAGTSRLAIEGRRRAASVPLKNGKSEYAVVRDQLPMDDKGLQRCLRDGLQPEDWYRLLNSKVFFWLRRERLLKLLNAGAYRSQEHDVLELDARPLVEAHAKRIWFCPINSGCTKPFPHPRGNGTFSRIDDYRYADWKKVRRRGERVVELALDNSVRDIAKYVRRVVRMKGSQTIETIFEAK